MLYKSGAKSDTSNVLRSKQYTHNNKSKGRLPLSSSSIAVTLSCAVEFVSGGNEVISPLIYFWEETDSTYYAETFFLLPPREYVFTSSCRSEKCRGGCNFKKSIYPVQIIYFGKESVMTRFCQKTL